MDADRAGRGQRDRAELRPPLHPPGPAAAAAGRLRLRRPAGDGAVCLALFLLRLAHRRQHPGQGPEQDTQGSGQDSTQDTGPPAAPKPPAGDHSSVLAGAGQDGEPSRVAVRVLLAAETLDAPVAWQDVTTHTGLSRSRAYALLREERARQAGANGHHPPAMLGPHPGQEAP